MEKHNSTQKLKDQRKISELEDKMLIDFFLHVGMPEKYAIDLTKMVENDHEGDYSSTYAFEAIETKIREDDLIQRRPNDCVLDLYPDCQDKGMDSNDPRKNYLDVSIISKMPEYAFPLGFRVKHEENRPVYQMLPMIFNAGQDITYLQYLIFYESLEDQYAKAKLLYDEVQIEIDKLQFQETGDFSDMSQNSDENLDQESSFFMDVPNFDKRASDVDRKTFKQ